MAKAEKAPKRPAKKKATKPAATKPVATKPAATKAAASKPKADRPAATKPKADRPASREPVFSMETIDGRSLRVAHWPAPKGKNGKQAPLPLLFFNGIGANIEAVSPLADLLDDRDFLIFDMPGVGGSPDPVLPYNAISMARVAALLLDKFEMPVVDVMGVSWGGAMAQQFAFQHAGRVNRVILTATSAGMLMIPGNPKALIKMADPRRYMDANYLEKNFKTLYGGATAGKDGHIDRITPPSKTGYLYQLLAMTGWTSAPFLPFLKKETLIMMGDEDQIVPVINGRFLNMLIPNSRLYTVKGGGHLFLLSHVDETIGQIRSFLDGVTVDGGKKAA